MSAPDPVALTAELVRCRSVTPDEGGALALLDDVLSRAGFACTRVDRDGTPNLFARWGSKAHLRSFGFNGHTDVVPPGDPQDWSADPFGGVIRDGRLYGRGAADMKSGVAAFVAAAVEVTQEAPDGAIVIAITGDEEGDATNGTIALLDWMEAQGERMAACIVGEPTCPERLGDTIKIGRRGSLTARLVARGRQGHAAYPHRALNPLPALIRLLSRLDAHELDRGTEHFDPSTLTITTIDTGNPASNVIPSEARATVNIRFNDAHTSATLTEWLSSETGRVAAETGVEITLAVSVSGECFLTRPGPLSDLVAQAVEAETGLRPELSTSGGTSDARFIHRHCPVVEFGLVGQTMHQTDEHVEVEQIRQLTGIYRRILRDYFGRD